jgi:hypothetical protein
MPSPYVDFCTYARILVSLCKTLGIWDTPLRIEARGVYCDFYNSFTLYDWYMVYTYVLGS